MIPNAIWDLGNYILIMISSLGEEQFAHLTFLQFGRQIHGDNVQCLLGPSERAAIEYSP